MTSPDQFLSSMIPEPLTGTSEPCPEHNAVGCASCAARIARAQEVAQARLRGVTTEEIAPAAKRIPVQPSAPTDSKPGVVALAEAYANLLQQLQRSEKQLVGAEARVEYLQATIVELKAVTETARKKLAEYLTAN
jgi:hypothetical protein